MSLLSRLVQIFDNHKDDPENARLAALEERKRRAFAWFNKKLLPKLPGMLEAAALRGCNRIPICTYKDEDCPEEFQFDLSHQPDSPLYKFVKENGLILSDYMLHRSVCGWYISFPTKVTK